MAPRLRRPLAILSACAAAVLARPAAPEQTPLVPLDFDRGANGLALALRRVGTTGRVLYVTAHPDDEHNGVLVRLSHGLGIRTSLLTLTRGEGGQNAIGPELFDALGVLRTGELLALHRYDAVEQYFGRAYEFGFSFSVEETFAKWGHEDTLGDVVRVVRAFRPDVILTLPLQGEGGGQHHQAAGRLAAEAFRAAADPTRFPEQLSEGLRPWQTRKIYVGGVGGATVGPAGAAPIRVPTGVYDPLLGGTWQQVGSRARAMHRCQMASQLVADSGPAEGVYTLLDAEPPVSGPETDLLQGVDTSLHGLARFSPSRGLADALASLQSRADVARAAFDAGTPDKTVPALAEALSALRALEGELGARVPDPAARAEVADRLVEEEQDIEQALTRAEGVVVEARADAGLVTPGREFGVAVSLWNQAARPMELEAVALDVPEGWSAERRDGEPGVLAAGAGRTLRFTVRVAPQARVSQPYWRRMADRDRNTLVFPVDATQPWAAPDVVARARTRIGGVETTLRSPAMFRYDGPFVGGEKRHVVQVVPELGVRVSPEITALPLAAAVTRRPIELHAFARRYAPGSGEAELRVEAPAGWSVRPREVRLRFAYEGEEAGARFDVTPPARVAPGVVRLRAVAVSGGREYRDGLQVVEYEHVERRQLVRPAEARLLALEVRTAPGVSVAYVTGPGDAVADAIERLGLPLARLSADDLAFGDLSRFTTIVTGIRAYDTRPDLRSSHARLMQWAEQGGHLVVQYNREPFNRLSGAAPVASAAGPGAASSPFAPYPAVVSSDRISDETAPIRVLAPRHPLLNAPNRIGEGDWAGWVQERGIQFLAARDPRYTELLAATDPFPYNPGEKRGMLVDAAVGRGTWTYVGLALFRQVPAGVPGGWRLLANLVSRPRPRGPAQPVGAGRAARVPPALSGPR